MKPGLTSILSRSSSEIKSTEDEIKITGLSMKLVEIVSRREEGVSQIKVHCKHVWKCQNIMKLPCTTNV
jgi:hypothetical protein